MQIVTFGLKKLQIDAQKKISFEISMSENFRFVHKWHVHTGP